MGSVTCHSSCFVVLRSLVSPHGGYPRIITPAPVLSFNSCNLIPSQGPLWPNVIFKFFLMSFSAAKLYICFGISFISCHCYSSQYTKHGATGQGQSRCELYHFRRKYMQFFCHTSFIFIFTHHMD